MADDIKKTISDPRFQVSELTGLVTGVYAGHKKHSFWYGVLAYWLSSWGASIVLNLIFPKGK